MSNAAQVRKFLESLPAGIRQRIQDELEAQAAIVARSMLLKVPRRSGNLQRSIRVEQVSPLRVAVKAGGPLTTKPVRKGASVEYDYALAVEYGTQEQAAEPFFWKSWREKRRRVRAAIKRRVRQEVERRS